MARPMPREAPVTMAVLPDSENRAVSSPIASQLLVGEGLEGEVEHLAPLGGDGHGLALVVAARLLERPLRLAHVLADPAHLPELLHAAGTAMGEQFPHGE